MVQSSAGVERYVVLKRVHKHRASDIQFVHMFLDEARLAAQLQHPNIAQVFDTGKLGDTYFKPTPKNYKVTWMARNEDFFAQDLGTDIELPEIFHRETATLSEGPREANAA